MKTNLLLVVVVVFVFMFKTAISENFFCNSDDNFKAIEGKWVRLTQSGPVGMEFTEEGTIEVDFGIDGTVDVVSEYEIRNDTIFFTDKKGEMCPEPGIYKLEITDCYAAFDLLDDMCNGRIKMTMGFWTRPDFENFLGELSEKIEVSDNPELYLKRARIALALGKSQEAKSDLDIYLQQKPNDAKALINRAGTRFPHEMEGALHDCSKAIELEPENKNAWFLGGLANWELGFKEEACNDFSRAIELGFSILKIAEEQRCSEYWETSK
ncbi:tetratricopeptide repeat protein [Mariniphaga sp.]|uniref:tetratricopeptide repeat protein n=1 Tax=Mariniphaga sp. TaxID=1954475 RepID=UPI00356A78A5